MQIRVKGVSGDAARQVLKSMPYECTERKYTDGLFLLGGNGVLELIPKVNQRFKAFNIPIEDMTVRKRTLEDAFIAVTGRGLRE
ncbi:hypothetical protein D3C79_1056810 [compost metagenome]